MMTARQEIHRLRMRMENELARENGRQLQHQDRSGRHGGCGVCRAVPAAASMAAATRNCAPPARSWRSRRSARWDCCPRASAETLLTGYKFLRKLENRLRIIHDYSVNDLSGPRIYLNKLARRLGYDAKLKNPGAALICDYEEMTGKIRDVFDRLFLIKEQ